MKRNNHKFKMLTRVTSMVLVVLMIFSMADFASMIGYAATQTATEEVQLEEPAQLLSTATSTAPTSVNYNDGNHYHTFACYEQWQKVCGYENGELDEYGQKHYHTFDCFTHSGSLICDKQEGAPEHEHTSACEVVAEVYICGHEGHEHNEKCIDPDYGKTPARYVYYLNFDSNGGDGGPTRQVQESNDTSATFTIPDGKPTRSGYRCMGWLDKETNTAYHAGDTIIVTEERLDVRLYAIWEYGEEDITDTNLPQAGGSELRYYCGKGEHEHTSDCVYKVYKCGEEELRVEEPVRKPQRAPQAAAASAQNVSVKWVGVKGTSTGTVISGDTLSTSCVDNNSALLLELSFTATKTYTAQQFRLYLPAIAYKGSTVTGVSYPKYSLQLGGSSAVVSNGWSCYGSMSNTWLTTYPSQTLSGISYDETKTWHALPNSIRNDSLAMYWPKYLYNTTSIPEGSHVSVQFEYTVPTNLYPGSGTGVKIPYTFKLYDSGTDTGDVATLYCIYKGGKYSVDSLKQYDGERDYQELGESGRVYYWSSLLEERYGVTKDTFAADCIHGDFIYVEIPFALNVSNKEKYLNLRHVYTLNTRVTSSLPSLSIIGTYLAHNNDNNSSSYKVYHSRVNNGDSFIMHTTSTEGGTSFYDPLLLCLVKVKASDAVSGDSNNTVTATGTVTLSAHSNEPLCPVKDFSVSAFFSHSSPKNTVTYRGAQYGAMWCNWTSVPTEIQSRSEDVYETSIKCGVRHRFTAMAQYDFTPPSTVTDNITGELSYTPTEFVLSLDYFFNCNQQTPIQESPNTLCYESVTVRRVTSGGSYIKSHEDLALEGYYDNAWHTFNLTDDTFYGKKAEGVSKCESLRLRVPNVREESHYRIGIYLSLGNTNFFSGTAAPNGLLWLGISGVTQDNTRLLSSTCGYTGTSSTFVTARDKVVYSVPDNLYMYRKPLRLTISKKTTGISRTTSLIFRDTEGNSIPVSGQSVSAAEEVDIIAQAGVYTGAETGDEYIAICKQIASTGDRSFLTADAAVFTLYVPNYLEFIRSSLPSFRNTTESSGNVLQLFQESKEKIGDAGNAILRNRYSGLTTGSSGVTVDTVSCEHNFDGSGTTRVKIKVSRDPSGGWQNIYGFNTPSGHFEDFGFAVQAVCSVKDPLFAGQQIRIPMRVEFEQGGQLISTSTVQNSQMSSIYFQPVSADLTSIAWKQRNSSYAMETGISFTVPSNTLAGLTGSSLHVKSASDYGYSVETSGVGGDIFSLRARYTNTTGSATNVVTYVPIGDGAVVRCAGVDLSMMSSIPDVYVTTQQISLDAWVQNGTGRAAVVADDGVFVKIDPNTYTEWDKVTVIAFDYAGKTFSANESSDAYLRVKLVDKLPPSATQGVYSTKVYFSDTHSGGNTRTSYGNGARIVTIPTYTTPLTLHKRVGDRIYVRTDAGSGIARFQPTAPITTPTTSTGTVEYVYEYSFEGETPIYNDTILISDMFETASGSEFKGTPKYIQLYSKLQNAEKELEGSVASELLNIRIRVYYTTVQGAKPMFMKSDGKVYLYKGSGWTQLLYWSPATRNINGTGYLTRNPHKELPEGTTGLTFVIYSEYAKQEGESITLTDLDSTDCFSNKWDFATRTGTSVTEYHTSLVERLSIIVGMEANLDDALGKRGALITRNQASLEYVTGNVLEQLKSEVTEYTVNFEEASGLDHELPDSGGSGMIPYIYLSAATLLTTATILTYRRKRKYHRG